MQTPVPAQIEHWIKIATDKRSHGTLKEDAMLHLSTIRDIIDQTLAYGKKKKHETMSVGRHSLRRKE